MHTKLFMLTVLSCLSLTNICLSATAPKRELRSGLPPEREPVKQQRDSNNSRIDQIKNGAKTNNSFSCNDAAIQQRVIDTLLHNHAYCIDNWRLKNFLAAFVCASLPLHAAQYSSKTHFFLHEQQQCYISETTQRLIFDQYKLYQSADFRAALKYLPDYQQQIERVHHAMRANGSIYNQIGSVGRAFVQHTYDDIEQNKKILREQQLEQQRLEAQRKQQLTQQKHCATIEALFKTQATELQAILQHYENIPSSSNNQCNQRILARAGAIKESLQHPNYTNVDYLISFQQAALLSQFAIDSAAYTHLLGNQLQHQLHTELLAWLNEAHKHIQRVSEQKWLGAFIDTASKANRFGKCLEPLFILDFAWSALDVVASCEPPVFESEYVTALCAAGVHLAKVDKQILQLCKEGDIQPFLSGALQGITSVASLLQHPLDSVGHMAHHLGRIISRLDTVTNTLLSGNAANAHKQAINLVDDFIQFQTNAARTFANTPEDIVIANATSLAVETATLHGCGKAVSMLANKAVAVIKNSDHLERISKTAHRLVRRAQSEACAQAAITAEGVELAASEIASAEGVSTGVPLEKLPKYVSKTTSYILADESAVLALAEKFKTFKLVQYTQELGFEYVQITEKYLKHIFGIEIEEVVKRSGLVKRRLGGLHHDYLEILEKSGKIEIVAKKINELSKITEVDILIEETLIEGKTFFPSSWTQEECISNILDSLNDLTKKPFLQGNGKWKLIGKTKEGIEIETIIKTNGELVTSYPIF